MDSHATPREILAETLAPEAPLSEVLRWAVAHACVAPSELNAQPWRFVVALDPEEQTATIELLLDRSRLLPVIDPTSREAVLACGAALLNLRLALHGVGLGTRVDLVPDPDHPDLLARVSVGGEVAETPQDRLLRAVIALRTTHRGAFEPADVPTSLVDQLVAEGAREGALVSSLAPAERALLLGLHTQAEQRLWEDASFRREVGAWSRPNSSARGDGVPGYARGLSTWRSWIEPARVRAGMHVEAASGESDSEVLTSPVLLVIGAARETREALLRTGAGLQRLLLSARVVGLSASYLNATLHVPDLRQELGRAVQVDYPQVLLRVGFADVDRPTPRRAAVDVVELRRVATP